VGLTSVHFENNQNFAKLYTKPQTWVSSLKLSKQWKLICSLKFSWELFAVKLLCSVSCSRWLNSNKAEFINPTLFTSLSLMLRMEVVYEAWFVYHITT